MSCTCFQSSFVIVVNNRGCYIRDRDVIDNNDKRTLKSMYTTHFYSSPGESSRLRRLRQLLGDTPTASDRRLLRELFFKRRPSNVCVVLASVDADTGGYSTAGRQNRRHFTLNHFGTHTTHSSRRCSWLCPLRSWSVDEVSLHFRAGAIATPIPTTRVAIATSNGDPAHRPQVLVYVGTMLGLETNHGTAPHLVRDRLLTLRTTRPVSDFW